MPTQPKKSSNSSLTQLMEEEMAVHEGIELIELCREAFHAKLDEIEGRLNSALTQKAKDGLREEAEHLYQEYKKTISLIEESIDKLAKTSKPS